MLLFPIFQRTFGLFRHPIFWLGCKGKSRMYSNKIFLYFSSNFLLIFREPLFEELVLISARFFERIAKIRWDSFTTKFYSTISQKTFALTASLLRTYFPFFQSGCKDKQMKILTKFNCKKKQFIFFTCLSNGPLLCCSYCLSIKNLFPFFQSGCKDNQMEIFTKFNCKKKQFIFFTCCSGQPSFLL